MIIECFLFILYAAISSLTVILESFLLSKAFFSAWTRDCLVLRDNSSLSPYHILPAILTCTGIDCLKEMFKAFFTVSNNKNIRKDFTF